MDKRYYYTDPLKASFMAREFGVDFECGVWRNFDDWPKGKIYVHPDSLHIFEHQEFDGTATDSWIGVYRKNSRFIGGESPIIYRNNKHFFMPEVENAAIHPSDN